MSNSSRPSLFRILAVMFYDTLILLSILMLAILIVVVLNDGAAIEQDNLLIYSLYLCYLFIVSWLFYSWFWTHGGQTIGMRAWNVFLLSEKQPHVEWHQATLRFIAALISWVPVGLGFWWQYLGKEKKCWPDIISGTYLHYNKESK